MLCELLENSFRHVAFLLIGIHVCELEVFCVIVEVRFDLNRLPISGYCLIVPASQIKDVATTINRIGIVGAHRSVTVIDDQCSVKIAHTSKLIGLDVEEIVVFWIYREPLP